MLEEIKKVDQLCDYEYLRTSILLPAIEDAKKNGRLSQETADVLTIVAKKQVIKSGDLKPIYPEATATTISRKVQAMIQEGLLAPEKEHGRSYILSFANRYMMPSITKMLSAQGFLPNTL
ncbi:hypothetical protein [Porphyromonas loveana]|uniref:hypothetical protein n=1 Tax=Porphyromonas loveana TaxID=1884669 RepID=UPI00359F6203